MTPNKQRIAIAKLCPNAVEWHDGLPYWKGAWSSFGEGNERFAEFDPVIDLNAMAEAERVLTFSKRCAYRNVLQQVVSKGLKGATVAMEECIHASASQRAEAFLKTLGLWVEDEELKGGAV